jgi:hypothetical protein
MLARLVPLFFDPGRDEEFDQQIRALRGLLAGVAEILPEQPLGTSLAECDGVVFPQLLGEAYRQLAAFKALRVPILIITSEFGTVSMWDWEITSYLRAEGVATIAPYNLEQARLVCRLLALKRDLRSARLLVFQDNPGEGFQASIFKRFYWWEEECTQRMQALYGVQVVKKSYRQLAAAAQSIPDQAAAAAWAERQVPLSGVSNRALLSALKLYLALKEAVQEEGHVIAAGTNCLNESHFSDTTPCLAWSLLFAEQGLLWGCEADTVTMLTQAILYRALQSPVMMSNLYPFLMGQAALKHEHIPEFPRLSEPENHILAAHCGYLGVLPQTFASEWTLKPKVLAIVDENATAIDARLPEGKLTLAKLGPSLRTLSYTEAALVGYAQYPDSHCLNGAVIRVPDGRHLMRTLDSHHYLLLPGHARAELELAAQVFDWELQAIG